MGLGNVNNAVDVMFPRGSYVCEQCGSRTNQARTMVLGANPGPRCKCGGRLVQGPAAKKPEQNRTSSRPIRVRK